MRRIFMTVISLVIFSAVTIFSNAVSANDNLTETDFETREIQLICAISSLAAYSNDNSYIVRSNLNSRGWKINAITSGKNGVNVKAYVVDKTFYDGHTVKILVISGTEDLKDVEVDFKLGGVTLHKDKNDGIFVHKGFRDYADATLAEGVAEYLVEDLKNNPNETLYLTGHSLGGSVALVAALRLNDMGVDKNRMKVITFGALAVGNKALVDEYESKIDLTRIEVKGDVIKKMFAPFGYVQFGNQLTWKPAKSANHHEHKVAIYVDCALRNYFDAEGFTFSDEGGGKIDTSIYVAPVRFVKKNFAAKDEKYIYGILRTGLTSKFNGLTFDETPYIEVKDADNISDDILPLIATAKNLNREYVLVQLVSCERVRDSREDEYNVMLYEFVYDLNGMPVFMQTSGMTTRDVTILEAASFVQENLHKKFEKAVSQNADEDSEKDRADSEQAEDTKTLTISD